MLKPKNKSNKITTKTKVDLTLAILFIFLCLAFFVNGKFYRKNAISVNIINHSLSKTSTNAPMNLRESKLNLKEPSKNSLAKNVYNSDGQKRAYLTFDDGPSPKTTPGILKVLDRYNIKATFFIVGSLAIISPYLVKLEANDGQSIGNHTYSHEYKQIYSNINAFIKDVNKCDAILKSIIGSSYNSKLLRFPGGSFGPSRAPFREAIKKLGYRYIDWNDLSGDADGQNITVIKLLYNIKKYTKGKEHVVILMHDAPDKKTTVQALPEIIEYLKSQGYSFDTLK